MYQRKKRYKSETKTFRPYMLDTLQTNITNIEMYQRKNVTKVKQKHFILTSKIPYRQYSVVNTEDNILF